MQTIFTFEHTSTPTLAMKKILYLCLFFLFFCQVSFAQQDGDYGSAVLSGDWNVGASWERYNSTGFKVHQNNITDWQEINTGLLSFSAQSVTGVGLDATGGDYAIFDTSIICPIITANYLPIGVVGMPYIQTITVSGGTPPYTFSQVGTLPNGLVLNPATGVISGIPTEIGYFSFDINVTDANNCVDSRSYSNFIILNGPPGNRGVYFDGVDDRIDIPNHSLLNFAGTSSYTVSMWVKVPDTTGYRNIFHKNHSGVNTNQIVLTLLPNGALSFATDDFSNSGWHYANSAANLVLPNQWTHITIVYHGGTGTKELYINGTPQTLTNSGTGNPSQSLASNSPWIFGSAGGWGGGHFWGQIDDIRIFNTARDALEIQLDMTTNTFNYALAYWNFDDDATGGVQTTATNQGILGASADGTLQNGTLWALRTTNTLDDGLVGSLRWAINEANTDTDKDYIDFSIPTAGVKTITLSNPLPAITNGRPIILDGLSQKGNPNVPLIEINGDAVDNAIGINIQASDCIVRGFIINRFNAASGGNDLGIYVGNGVNNTWIYQNYIGTDETGTMALPNTQIGIWINGASNTIIGTNNDGVNDINERNIIAGNGGYGTNADILIGGNANGTIIRNNYIGINITGNTTIGASTVGILSTGTTGTTIIGGNTATQRNIIGGRSFAGIQTLNTNTCIIQGNYIGTNSAGTTGIANGIGIFLNSNGNTVGGTGLNEGNLIAYNSTGIQVNTGVGNIFQRNNIYSNTTAGITLVGTANNSKAAPIITSSTTSLIRGTCQAGDIVEVYNDTPQTGSTNQGRTYLGNAVVTGTTWTFSGTFNLGDRITATATDGTNGTSAFCDAKIVSFNVAIVTSATNITNTSFRINWISPTPAPPFYILQLSTDNFSTTTNVNGLSNTIDFYDVTGVSTNQVYQYRLVSSIDGTTLSSSISNIKMTSTILPPGSGSALSFDGTTRYATIPDDNINISNNFTIEMWVNSSNTSQTSKYLFGKNAGGADQWGVIYGYVPNTIEFFIGAASFSGTNPSGGSQMTLPSGWHHVAYTYDGINFRGYIDGIEKFSNNITFNILTNNNNLNNAPYYVGSANTTDGFFEGQIDEVKMWDTARSQAQIQSDMCRKINNVDITNGNYDNLKIYLRFDENTGTTTENKARFATKDATIVSATPTLSSVPLGDVSTSLYNAGSTISLSNTEDTFTTNGFTLSTNQGIHIYKVNESPNNTITPANMTGLETSHYFGVFPIGISNYNAAYDYTNNLNITNADLSSLASRNDNAAGNWNWENNSLNNATSKTMNVGGNTTQKEFIAGFIANPLLVTSNADANVPGTLRYAINFSNHNGNSFPPSRDNINFDNSYTITPINPLPNINVGNSVNIDGQTNNIIIDGGNSVSNGLILQSSNSIIQNLTIQNFTNAGVQVSSSTNNNQISKVLMACNGNKGIEILSGANGGKNPPTINTCATTTEIKGTSTAGDIIEIFKMDNSTCASNINPQGKIFLGSVTADVSGNWSLTTFLSTMNVGDYVVATATDASGNTSEFSARVEITLAPTPDITGNFNVCQNATSNFYTTNLIVGNNYVWNVTGGSSIASNNSIEVNWINAGTGVVSVIESNPTTGCFSINTKNVVINPLPTPVIVGNDAPCVGSSPAYSTTNVAGNTYTWSIINGDGTITSPNTSSTSITWNSAGNATIQVIETTPSGCSSSTTFNIFVNPLPTPIITGNTNVMNGGATIQTYSVTQVTNHIYNWVVTGGTIQSGQNTNTITVQWTSTNGNINITQTNTLTGCIGTNNLSVNIIPNQAPLVQGSLPILPNIIPSTPTSTTTVTFNAGSPDESFQIFIGANVTSSNPSILQIVNITTTPTLNTTAGNMNLTIQYRVNPNAVITNQTSVFINISVKDNGGTLLGGQDTYNGSISVNIDPMPTAPNNFLATPLSVSAIRLTWNNYAGNEGYEIQKSFTTTFTALSPIISITNNLVTSYDDTSLTSGNYCYRIRAKVTNGFTNWSLISCATVGTAVVTAPTNLSTTSITSNSVALRWDDNSIDESEFEVERSSFFTNNQFVKIASVSPSSTTFATYVDNTVMPFIDYTYRVRARSITGISPYTNTLTVTTLVDPNAPPTSIPVDLNAVPLSTKQIDVKWSYNNLNSNIRFALERADGLTGIFTPIAIIRNTNTAGEKIYNDTTNIVANNLYCYRMRAIGSGGFSPYTDTTCAAAICNLIDIVVVRDDVNGAGTALCSGKSASLKLTKRPFGATYQWRKNGNDIIGATFPNYLANETGQYSCLVTVGTGLGACSNTTLNQMLIITQPVISNLTISYNIASRTLQSSVRDVNSNTSYQWYKDYQLVNTTNTPDFNITNSGAGVYFLILMRNGCGTTSNLVTVGDNITSIENYDLSNFVTIYPNPTSNQIDLTIEHPVRGEYECILTDMNGKVIFKLKGEKNGQTLKKILDLNNLNNGMYLLEWRLGKYQARKKVIKR